MTVDLQLELEWQEYSFVEVLNLYLFVPTVELSVTTKISCIRREGYGQMTEDGRLIRIWTRSGPLGRRRKYRCFWL